MRNGWTVLILRRLFLLLQAARPGLLVGQDKLLYVHERLQVFLAAQLALQALVESEQPLAIAVINTSMTSIAAGFITCP